MPFSFPNNPSVNDQSTQNGRVYVWTGNAWEIASNFSLIPSISGGSYISVTANNDNYVISATGLQPSGNYSSIGHSHTTSDITNFASGVSGLLPSISGSGYAVSSFANNVYTISISGLQPSGNYSTVGHTHTSSNITDFNSSVSGLLPTISNSGNNRILTSNGTSTGIIAESDLFFDDISGRLFTNGYLNIEQTTIQRLDSDPASGKNSAFSLYIEPSGLIGNPDNTHNIYGVFGSINPRAPNSNHNVNYYGTLGLIYSEIPSGVSNSGSIIGLATTAFRNNRASNVGNGWYDDNGSLNTLYGISINYGHSIGQSGIYGPAPTGVNPYTDNAYGVAIGLGKGYGTINNAYDLFIGSTNFDTGTVNNHYSIYQAGNRENYLGGSLKVTNGLSAPTNIFSLGSVSGNVSINYDIDKQIQTLTLDGTSTNFIEGTGWDLTNQSVDVLLEITVTSTTTVVWTLVDDIYNPFPAFTSGTYLVLLRSMGSTIQSHYLGNKTN